MELYTALTLLSLFAVVILGMQVANNSHIGSPVRTAFLATLFATTLAIFGEWSGIAFQNYDLSDYLLVKIAKAIDYSATPAAAALIAGSVLEGRHTKKILAAICINTAVHFLSIPFGLTFVVDASGAYSHGPLYWVYIVFDVVALGFMIMAFYNYGKKRPHRHQTTLFCILALILFGFIAQTFDSNLRITNLGIVLGGLLLFTFYLEYNQQDMSKEIDKSTQENQRRQRAMEALSYNLLSCHIFNRTTNEITAIKTTDQIEELLAQAEKTEDKIVSAMNTLVTENYLNQMLLFIDFNTLDMRLRTRKAISLEFVGKVNGWCRSSFTVIDRDVNGNPYNILFTVAVIEEEKRYEAELLSLSTTDALTGLFNQRAYRDEIARIRREGMTDNLTVITLDMNGLKTVNDTYGHAAGDDLIIGAGNCIKMAFGESGKCFRLGGDEFSVVIDATNEEIRSLCQIFDSYVGSWSHPNIKFLSISYGWASHTAFPELNIDQLTKLADQEMYAAKRRYYETSGVDRRKEHF